jgi:wyosine [tRNA(Phe)-imidazoG37] synthetase (radical SAM superfamily)
MPTILFDDIIFGPVKSRRLGISLGINLLPTNGKLCTYDCIYCECGLNADSKGKSIPETAEVISSLEKKLKEMHDSQQPLDVITFAGNGEPSMHPGFATIIDETIRLRNSYFPYSKVSVLSNASKADKPEIFDALLKVDQAILKLDTAFDETAILINQPVYRNFKTSKLVETLKRFKGKVIIQTLFIRGTHLGQTFDNTTDKEVDAWIELLKEIQPESVMIYTIDREPAVKTVEKISLSELTKIASKVEQETGIKTSVAG